MHTYGVEVMMMKDGSLSTDKREFGGCVVCRACAPECFESTRDGEPIEHAALSLVEEDASNWISLVTLLATNARANLTPRVSQAGTTSEGKRE